MKIKDIQEKGLLRKNSKVIDDMEVNLSDFISDEEFRRKVAPLSKSNYREDAFYRLGGMLDTPGVSFAINCNLASTFVEKCIKITCPRCDVEMDRSINSSGNGDHTSHNYRCPNCNATASLRLPTKGSLSFKSDPSPETQFMVVIRTKEKLSFKGRNSLVHALKKSRGVFDVRFDSASPFNVWVIINNPMLKPDTEMKVNREIQKILDQLEIDGQIDYTGK